jgi:hypothetical protein
VPETPPGFVIYLSYGEGPHVEHLQFSILSALRFRRRGTSFPQIVVYTDTPQTYIDLPIDVRRVTRSQFQTWRDQTGLNHMIKPKILQLALSEQGQPCVYLDADTYFRRHPRHLFRRLRPGTALMHLEECLLGEVDTPSQHKLADAVVGESFHDSSGHEILVERGFPLWNAGVIGLDPTQMDLLEEVIVLASQIYERSGSHIAEQAATAIVLGRNTTIRPASDVLYHYWPYVPPYGPPDWENELRRRLAESSGLPPEQRGKWVTRRAYRVPFWGREGRLERRVRSLLDVRGDAVVRRSV